MYDHSINLTLLDSEKKPTLFEENESFLCVCTEVWMKVLFYMAMLLIFFLFCSILWYVIIAICMMIGHYLADIIDY